MQLRQTYVKVMSTLIPAGAVGASLLLGSVLPSNAAERPAATSDPPVATRLAAIREAVFVVVGPVEVQKPPDPNVQLTWGNRWNNWGWRGSPRRGGWRSPRWNNWRNGWPNWRNSWRNW
jgi:hypothetical protein